MKLPISAAAAALVAVHSLAIPTALQAQTSTVSYGTDDGDYANDGECDDPRFVGSGVSQFLLTDNIGLDASDCSKAVANGIAEPNPLFIEPASNAAIIYGDDASDYANDGECDDIRFTGKYASQMVYIVDDIGHDASDCRAAVESGLAHWQGGTPDPMRGIEF